MSQPVSGSRKWVLVAEDDAAVRAVWWELLTAAGYRTLEARTGHDAIELMRVVVPDLVILDLRMPGLTGGEVMSYLHSSPVLQRIPVLVVSGFLDDEPSRQMLGLNIVGRLPKPVDAATLLATVHQALDSSRRDI